MTKTNAKPKHSPGKKTTLALGLIQTPVALYKAIGDSSTVEWEKAGPNGGVLNKNDYFENEKGERVDAPQPAASEPASDSVEDLSAAIQDATSPKQVIAKTELVEEGSGEIVEVPRRGIRDDDGKFIDLTEKIGQIEEHTKLDELRIIAFIDVGQVPRDRILGSYFLGADSPGAPKVLRLIYEAQIKTRRVGLVKWTKSSKQALGIIVANGKRGFLEVLELAWAEDFREPHPNALAIQQAQVSDAELAAAVKLIETQQATAKTMDALRDDRREQFEALVAAALAGDDYEVPGVPVKADENADITESLEQSSEHMEAVPF